MGTMKLPAYWSKATATELDSNSREVAISRWRWSDVSAEDAHASALTAARAAVKRFLAGEKPSRYGYGESPAREEVLQQFYDGSGQLIAAVTQNAYGSLVLNTAGVMFIDLDFKPVTIGEAIGHFFRKLFGKAAMDPDAARESEARSCLERLASDGQFSLRIYRTAAGMRGLATHALFDPTAESTRSLLQSVGADPLYVRLCKSRECFRARLTPKPWRCGITENKIGWPRETEEQQQKFAQWQEKYAQCHASFATCRFVASIGSGKIHPDAEMIVEVHDHVTRASESMALA